jgi:hypothetical protein
MRWTKPRRISIAGPEACELRISGRTILKAQSDGDGKWFWYMLCRDYPSRNTAGEPRDTLDDVKAEAMAFVKANAPSVAA